MPAVLGYAGLMGLLSVLLANHVLWARLRAGRLPAWQPGAAERVQGNFTENVPLALLLLLLVELGGAPVSFVHICGSALVILRLLHAWGLARYEGANYPRLIGAQGTFVLVSILAMTCLIQAGLAWN